MVTSSVWGQSWAQPWGQLIIRSGKRKINLNSGQLTRPEVDWLSCELGDWLKVPIDRR